MDFSSLLDTASKNDKKNSKKLSKLDGEVSYEKRKEIEKIKAEKMEKMRREMERRKREELARKEAERQRSASFKIPKKGEEQKIVAESSVQAFLRRKEEEKKRKAKEDAEKKEKLIQLRLAANGGKANKKIARHFGSDQITLQQKYGGDADHLETLMRREEREKEEAERLAEQYRSGVYKAIAAKKKIEEKVRTPTAAVKRPPMKTSEASRLERMKKLGFNNTNGKSGSSSSSAMTSHKSDTSMQRKRPPPESIDFAGLMRKAEKIAKGEIVVDEQPKSSRDWERTERSDKEREPSHKTSSHDKKYHHATLPTPRPPQPPPPKKYSKDKSAYVPQGLFKPLPEKQPSFMEESSSSSRSLASTPKVQLDNNGKRILPGDVRYKGPPPSKVSHKQQQSSSLIASKMDREKDKMRLKEEKREEERRKEREEEKRREIQRRKEAEWRKNVERKREIDKRKEMERRKDRSTYDQPRRAESFYRGDSDEDEDEDEYDSEMDDFIDDSGLDMDELSRKDFEETLGMINKNYDKKKWKMNERMIDERAMVADYRTIQKEEARSARLGLLEDIREATKGKSEKI